jgi:hypothetical protein
MIVGGLTANVYAQSLNFKVGLFNPSLQSDLWEINMENLVFDKEDLQGQFYALEYEQFMGRNLSFSVEAGYYTKDHYSFYRDYEYDDGSEIEQNVALQFGSLEVGFKLYPMGHRSKFAPYVGAGGGVYYWKYEQWGDFIDFENDTVDEGEYVETSAYSPGFNGKAGFVFRWVRSFGISAEVRYQYLKGNLSSFFEGFEKLDMSGVSINIGFHLFMK